MVFIVEPEIPQSLFVFSLISFYFRLQLTASEEALGEDHLGIDTSLITQILQASQQKVGLFTLKVFVDHAVTETLLDYRRDRDLFHFQSGRNRKCIVYNGATMRLMFDCWKLWRKNEDGRRTHFNEASLSCTETVLSCLQLLVQDTHVFRDTNCTQLRQLGIVQKLAFCLKNDPADELIPMTIDIFSALVGSPPDLDVINALIQVALFLLESTNTYIHHARSRYNTSFHFHFLKHIIHRYSD